MAKSECGDKKYGCDSCANRCTELCDECTNVEAPSGKERKPSKYIRLDEPIVYYDLDKEKQASSFDELLKKHKLIPLYKLKSIIKEAIAEEKTIPLYLVELYNHCIDNIRQFKEETQ